MCGITGIGSINGKLEAAWIAGMTDCLRHRGPDDEGFLAIDGKKRTAFPLTGKDSRVRGPLIEGYREPASFFLGHRRLSILDPSPSGHQPMCTPDGEIWVVFNGEIYNYIELREELTKHRFTFDTGSDTEVLLAAYRLWGEHCLEKFDGMWSFVLYDRRRNFLFGARDRFGVKPFYYFQKEVNGESYFAFASEIKALLTLPFVPKNIDPQILFDFLAFSGLDSAEEMLFKDIKELHPSYAFRYDLSDGQFCKWNYYSLEYRESWEPFNPKKSEEYIEKTRESIFNSIRWRLRSDVPVGSALSGGVDSSSIVCIISQLMKEGSSLHTGDRQKVFTAGFPGSAIDESQWAKIVADASQAQWYQTVPTAQEYLEDIEEVAYHQDTPYGSPSIYAQYRVMKLARENGVTVLLDGQGADELFTGYTMYYDVFFYEMLRNGDFKGFRNELKHLGNAPVNRSYIFPALLRQLRRNMMPYSLVKAHREKPKGHHRYIHPEFWEKHKSRVDLIRERDFKGLNSMLHQYFTRQKLSRLLKYEDRNSMRFSIESRTPFADHLALVESIFNIPSSYKIHEGWSKYLLRESMKGILPDEIRLRKDKKGFFVPDLEWLRQMKGELAQYITDDMGEYLDLGLVRSDLEKGMAGSEDENMLRAIWNVISLCVWKKTFKISN